MEGWCPESTARGGVRLQGPLGGRGVGRGQGGGSTEGNSHRDPGVGLHLASTPGFCDILEAGRQPLGAWDAGG